MSDYIYILTNLTIPDLVKVGRTTNLEERIKALSAHTGVPVPFECYYACEVEDGKDTEKQLHFGLGDHRINEKREFFRISPERVKALLAGWAIQEVTPNMDIVDSKEEQESLNRERARRPVFTFSMVDIPIGSEIVFFHDNTLTATVTNDREIEFEKSKGFISAITLDILNSRFGKNLPSIRGSDHWLFESETLTERRIRMEN